MTIPNDQKYICSYEGCEAKFNKQYLLTRHLRAHNDVKLYRCTWKNCEKSYTVSSNLKRHFKNHLKDYESGSEDDIAKKDAELLLLTAIHRGNENDLNERKSLKCTFDGCKAEFTKSKKLIIHERTHTGERPFQCTSVNCNKSYRSNSHLNRHLKTHSAVEKQYQCSKCNAVLKSLDILKKHYRRTHDETKWPYCIECDVRFKKKAHYERHKIEQHDGENFNKCEKCGKTFNLKSRLKRHLLTHSKSYQCSFAGCSSVFEKWQQLLLHERSDHRREYSCDHCNKKFSNKDNLRSHMRAHNSDEVLVCPYETCHKIYRYKRNLTDHIKRKHEGQLFTCDVCNATCCSKSKIAQHIQKLHMFKKKLKKRKQKKQRRDAGEPTKSVISSLIGVSLPLIVEKSILYRNVKQEN